jgi:hypothetical protein
MAQTARDPIEALAIALDGFELLIHRRQFPDAYDRWDGNWLQVTARLSRHGATVAVSGPLVDVGGLQRFREGLARLIHTSDGEAELTFEESNVLRLLVARYAVRGRLFVRCELSPEPGSQGHWFEADTEVGELRSTLRQLDAVLAAFPLRGERVDSDWLGDGRPAD